MRLLRTRIGLLLGAALAALGLAGLFGFEVSSATTSTTAAPTVGTIPPNAFTPGGGIDQSKVPDYVSVVNQSGTVVGYIKKQDLFMEGAAPTSSGNASGPTASDEATVQAEAVEPVYGPDLTTVVGHMEPGVGFVPEGKSASQVPSVTPTTVVSGQG